MGFVDKIEREWKRLARRVDAEIDRAWRRVAPSSVRAWLRRVNRNLRRVGQDLAEHLEVIAPVLWYIPAAGPLAQAALAQAAAGGAGGAAQAAIAAAPTALAIGPANVPLAPLFPALRRPRATFSREGLARELQRALDAAPLYAEILGASISGQYYLIAVSIGRRALEVEVNKRLDRERERAARIGRVVAARRAAAAEAAEAERAAIAADPLRAAWAALGAWCARVVAWLAAPA